MNDGFFEVTLIVHPKNPLQLQEIMTALVMAEDNTDMIYSFKTRQLTIETDEKVPWTLDGNRKQTQGTESLSSEQQKVKTTYNANENQKEKENVRLRKCNRDFRM